MTEVKVPEPFIISPFFKEGETLHFDLRCSFEEGISVHPLFFDILYSLQIDEKKPWLNRQDHLPLLLEKWKMNEPIIGGYFQVRDRNKSKQPMMDMTLTFLAFLFWANGLPVTNLKNLHDSVRKLLLKPVNAEERIAYLLATPNHHHAFSQLKQLYVEMQKKYAVSKIK